MGKIAIVTLGIGILLGFYHLLESLLGLGHSDTFEFEPFSLVDLFSTSEFGWIDSLPGGSLQLAANYLVTMPLFVLILCIGALFFLISLLFPQK
jgi:hypothetical protein